MRLVAVALVLLLAGCASPEQRAAQQQQQSEAYTRHLSGQCETLGYARFTDGWKQCMMQLHQQAQSHNSQMQGIMLNNRLQNLPYCNSLVPGLREYERAGGRCRN